MPQTDQQKIIEIRVRYDQAVQGIAKYTQAINQLKTEQQQLKDELKQGTISEQQYNTAMARNREQVKAYQADIRALSREYQNNIKEQRENEGSLVSLRAQLSRLTASYDQLGREMRKGEMGENLRKQIMEVSQELKEAEAETNRFYRNVGNYESGFKGLNMSVQQILREMPNAAMSMNTFFLAISNNIPMLVDEINRLREANKAAAADGKAGVSIWKALSGALFSWNTVISVGVTLLTVYGGEIVKWIGNLFKAKEQVGILTDEVNRHNSAMANAQKRAGEEIGQLRTLRARAEDVSLSKRARLAAVEELQKKYPAYLGNLTKEEILAGRASSAYKQLTQDILAAARARATQERIDELAGRQIQEQRGATADTNFMRRNREAYNVAIQREERRRQLRELMDDEGIVWRSDYADEWAELRKLQDADKVLIEQFNQRNERLENHKKNIAAYEKQMQSYTGVIKQAADAMGRLEYDDKEAKKMAKQQETAAQKAARLRAEANKKALQEQQKADELLNKLIENNLERRRAEITTQYDNEIETLKNRLATEKNLNADARKAMNSQITSLEKIKNQELAKIDEEAIRAEVERETQRLAWLLEAAGEDYRKRRDIKLRELEDNEKLEEARIKSEIFDEKEREKQLEAMHKAFNARRKAITDEYVKDTTDAQVKAINDKFTNQINGLGYDTGTDSELKKAELELNKWLEIRANARQEDGESAEAYAKRLQDIDAQVTAAKQRYNQAQINAEEVKWNTISSLTNSAAQLVRNFGAESKAMTALAKTLALATVAINTGKAISEAIATHAGRWDFWSIAPIIAQILSAMTSATSIINSAKFATGGLVSGPGTGTSDSIPAMLSNGESVMTARATGMFAPLLSTLNQLGGGVPITPGEPTPAIGEEFLAAAIAKGMERMPRPVVSVEEINKVSKRVEVIERMGRV